MRFNQSERIDEKTATRLQSCLNSEFKSTAVRCFRARKVALKSSSSDLLSTRISGFAEPFRGDHLMCCNIDNPEDLEVSMRDCQLVMQSAADPDVFYVKGGVTAITGSKHSHLAKDIDQPASTLKELPRRDPDMVEIDEKVYRQTGTVYIQGPVYLVILER